MYPQGGSSLDFIYLVNFFEHIVSLRVLLDVRSVSLVDVS